jgi:hypothetical protein
VIVVSPTLLLILVRDVDRWLAFQSESIDMRKCCMRIDKTWWEWRKEREC